MARPSDALRGKVAVVTGSTRGIGLGIAAHLAQAGASIVVCGRTMESVEAVYEQLAAIPGVQVLGAACDVRSLQDVEGLAEQAVARFGQIDLWFNNAAISGPFASTADVPPEAWREVVDTNLVGAFHGTRVALHYMLPHNQGKIVNLVGTGAREQDRFPASVSAYAASQAGILRFTQVVAREYAGTGLSVLAMVSGLGIEPHAATRIQEAGELAVHLAGPATDGVTGKLYEARPGIGQILRGILKRRKTMDDG